MTSPLNQLLTWKAALLCSASLLAALLSYALLLPQPEVLRAATNVAHTYITPRSAFLWNQLTGAASCEWPRKDHLPKHRHFQRAAVSACAIIKDESPYVAEWVAFHRAAGVGRITLFDDGSADRESVLAQLAQLHSIGVIQLYNVTDIVKLAKELRGEVEGVRRRWRAGSSSSISSADDDSTRRRMCGPTDEEIDHVRSVADECLSGRNASSHVTCQYAVIRYCSAWAKALGDGYHAVFDVDEFIWSPKPGCWHGGCSLNASNAPLTAGGGPDLLEGIKHYLSDSAYARMHSQVTIVGAMYGPNGYRHANWSDPDSVTGERPLVTATHVFSAPYDRAGYLVPPPVGCQGRYEKEVCTAAYPRKTIVAVRNNPGLPIGGMNIHVHAVGPQRLVYHAASERLRYNHYSYLSLEETYAKKVVRNRNPPSHAASQVATNHNGAAHWFSSRFNPSAADWKGLLRHCMASPVDSSGTLRPECGVALPDWRE